MFGFFMQPLMLFTKFPSLLFLFCIFFLNSLLYPWFPSICLITNICTLFFPKLQSLTYLLTRNYDFNYKLNSSFYWAYQTSSSFYIVFGFALFLFLQMVPAYTSLPKPEIRQTCLSPVYPNSSTNQVFDFYFLSIFPFVLSSPFSLPVTVLDWVVFSQNS